MICLLFALLTFMADVSFAVYCSSLKDLHGDGSCCDNGDSHTFDVAADFFSSKTYGMVRELQAKHPPFQRSGQISDLKLGNVGGPMACGGTPVAKLNVFLDDRNNRQVLRRDVEDILRQMLKIIGSSVPTMQRGFGNKCPIAFRVSDQKGFMCAFDFDGMKIGGSGEDLFFDNSCLSCNITWSSLGEATPHGPCCTSTQTPFPPFYPFREGGFGHATEWARAQYMWKNPSVNEHGFYAESVGGDSRLRSTEAVLSQLVDEHLQLCTSDPFRPSGLTMWGGTRLGILRFPCYPLGDPVIKDFVLQSQGLADPSALFDISGTSFARSVFSALTDDETGVRSRLLSTLANGYYAETTLYHTFKLYCERTPAQAEASLVAPTPMLAPVIDEDSEDCYFYNQGVNVQSAFDEIKAYLLSGGPFLYGRRANSLIPQYIVGQYSDMSSDAYFRGQNTTVSDITFLRAPKTGSRSGADVIQDLYTILRFLSLPEDGESSWYSSTRDHYAAPLLKALTMMGDLWDLRTSSGHKLAPWFIQSVLDDTLFNGHSLSDHSFTKWSPFEFEPEEYVTFEEAGTTWEAYATPCLTGGMPSFGLSCADPFDADGCHGVKPCLPLVFNTMTPVNLGNATDPMANAEEIMEYAMCDGPMGMWLFSGMGMCQFWCDGPMGDMYRSMGMCTGEEPEEEEEDSDEPWVYEGCPTEASEYRSRRKLSASKLYARKLSSPKKYPSRRLAAP
jgi:hypothetical protein